MIKNIFKNIICKSGIHFPEFNGFDFRDVVTVTFFDENSNEHSVKIKK